jgi:ABC-type branched-subunit amino acid transport system substrate-binding protein
MQKLSLRFAVAVFSILLIFGATHGLAQEKVLKVGVMAPFTGPSAQTGDEFKSVSTMAFDNINNQIGDYKIELIWIDSQSDPAKAAAAYAEAVERKGMEVGILNWHSSVAISVMDVAAQYKVPHLFAFGAAPIIDEKYKSDPEKYKYWCGKGWPVPAKLTLGYTECLQNAIDKGLWKPEKKLTAIYGEDTDWGRSQGEALTREFKKIGWEVLSQDYFPPTQTDFYPLLSKWRKEGVSVIAGTSTSAPAITALVKQADEVALGAMIIADGLVQTDRCRLQQRSRHDPRPDDPRGQEMGRGCRERLRVQAQPLGIGPGLRLEQFRHQGLQAGLRKAQRAEPDDHTGGLPERGRSRQTDLQQGRRRPHHERISVLAGVHARRRGGPGRFLLPRASVRERRRAYRLPG